MHTKFITVFNKGQGGDPRKNHGIGMGLQYANLHSVSLLNPMQQLKRNCAYIYQQNISKFCKDLHLSIILSTDISKVDRENSSTNLVYGVSIDYD